MSQHDQPDAMENIMADDDGIDELPPFAVKEAYVKRKVWDQYKDELQIKWGSKAFDNPDYERAMAVLTRMRPQCIKGWLTEWAEVNSFVNDLPNTDGIVLALFDKWTKDSVPEEEAIEIVRNDLKKHLRGSIGMPSDKIIRETVTNYRRDTQEGIEESYNLKR